MAQPGNFTPILLYGSSTPGNVPSAANLTNSATGSEIAINVADKNLFFKDSTNAVNTVPIRQSSTSSNGWLSSTDWNTFNNKSNTNGTVTSVAALTLGTTGTDLSSTVATGTTTPVITLNVPTASATNRGALSSTDWSTFNNKQAALVSGTNIKTVGGVSLLGSGDVGTLGVAYGGTGLTTLTANYIPYGNGTSAFSSSANLTFNGTTLTTANDASMSGLTIGKGGGAIASNTALGLSALASNTSGAHNVASGWNALPQNTSGSYNVACGEAALFSNTTSGNNVAIGYQALLSSNSGPHSALGYKAGYAVTSGTDNVFLGPNAGNASNPTTTGSANIYIGSSTGGSAAGSNYEIAIGFNINAKGSSTGFISPNGGGVYQGNNSAAWSITSDARLKKNIVDNTVGLDAISKIQVRNFEYRTADEVTELEPKNAIEIKGVQLGAIAQEIKAIIPDCVKEESTGVLSVDTTNLTWYLINAVKELNRTVIALQTQVSALTPKA